MTRIAIAIAVLFGAVDAAAQLPVAGDRDPSGRILAKVVVTMTEPGAYGHPITGLRFLVVSENGDRVSIRTDDAGTASTWLRPGSYRFVTPDPLTWEGNAYTWDLITPVRAGTPIVRLTQENASKIVSLTPAQAAPVAVADAATAPKAQPAASPQATSRTEYQTRKPIEGFHLGIALNGSAIRVDDRNVGRGATESGGGLNLDLGYNYASNFGVLFTVAGANISSVYGDYTLGQADLVARYSFAQPLQSFVPYLELGLTGISAAANSNVELRGGGGTGAIGFDYFFSRKAALDLNFRFTHGSINTLRVGGTSITTDNGLGVSLSRFNVGIEFFPGGR